MANKSGGHPGTWAKNGIRTALGHRMVLAVLAWLEARGLAQKAKGAVRSAIKDIHITDPETWGDYEVEDMRQGFYTAQKLPPPPIDPRDYQISELQKFGMSPDAARALADRLIEICTVKISVLGHDYVARLFGRTRRTRRLRTGNAKIEWLQRAADALDSPKPHFPIRPWDEASNANIEATKSALHEGLTAIDEIAARTGIKHRTQQELLCFLEDIGEARRLKHGHYGPPQEGAADYVRTGEIVWNMLETPASPEEVRLRAAAAGHDLTEGQVTGALHWLWKKAKRIVRPEVNLYARPGPGVTDHVPAHDAFILALRSGKKSMPEVISITGKNRGELQRALQRRLYADELVKQVGFRAGYEVRPGFRGRVGVYALTAKGRRLAHSAKFQ